MGKIMVFRSVDGADYRVSVERTSVDGLAAFVKFTRRSEYYPASSGTDGTMWVETGKLHAVEPRTTITKTATGRKAVMSDGTSVELVSKPAPKKAVPKKAASKSRTRTASAVEEF